jgi:hypothetical protein
MLAAMRAFLGRGSGLVLVLAFGFAASGASFWERLGLSRRGSGDTSAVPVLGLSEDQMIAGLRETLARGVEHAVAALGRENGFLGDVGVRIPMPESLKRVESGLRQVGQGKMADEFVTTLNRAAEKAVPEAAEVLAGAVRQMTLTDARAIVSGTNNAATEFFRRTSQTNLQTRLRPIVAKATEEAGVTGAYKSMVGRAGFLATLLGADAADLDDYITRRALDGLFVKIAEEERRIREDPAARTTELLRRVFGGTKSP